MKSDAQLDAEAAAPPVALDTLILQHRLAFRRDLFIPKLTTETPPAYIDGQTGRLIADDMSMIGPTISYRLWAYLNATGPFPWTRAYTFMRDRCRRTHTRGHHEHESWRGSLCGALVGYTVRHEWSFGQACYELYITPERAEPVLRSALTAIEQRMMELAERQEAWQHHGSWPRDPLPVHHHVPGVHEEDCPHPECVARRAA